MTTKADLERLIEQQQAFIANAQTTQREAVADAEARVREQMSSWSHRNDELLDQARRRERELQHLVGDLLDRIFGDAPVPLSDELWRRAVLARGVR